MMNTFIFLRTGMIIPTYIYGVIHYPFSLWGGRREGRFFSGNIYDSVVKSLGPQAKSLQLGGHQLGKRGAVAFY